MPVGGNSAILLFVAEVNSVGGGSANAGGAGKIHSLEELEARLRPQHSQPMPQPDHDLSAFKRLVSILYFALWLGYLLMAVSLKERW